MDIKRPFSELDWLSTPEPVRRYIVQLENAIRHLQQQLDQLEKRTEKLEKKTNKNSQNSSKPPSSDSPYNKNKRKTKRSGRKKGAQKGRKGHSQTMMEPNKTIPIEPSKKALSRPITAQKEHCGPVSFGVNAVKGPKAIKAIGGLNVFSH